MFVQLALLAGCDYVDNIRGLGVLTALPVVLKLRDVPSDRRLSRILLHLHRMGKTVRKARCSVPYWRTSYRVWLPSPRVQLQRDVMQANSFAVLVPHLRSLTG